MAAHKTVAVAVQAGAVAVQIAIGFDEPINN